MLNWTTFGSPDKVDQAVFGSQGISYRLEDGYWHPGPPPRGGRVSAVMFSQHLCASRVLAELPTLWLNPWANKPLLDRLPFATRTAHDTGEVFLAAESYYHPRSGI